MMESYDDKIASMKDEALLMAALNHWRAGEVCAFPAGDRAGPPLPRPQDQAAFMSGLCTDGASGEQGRRAWHREMGRGLVYPFHSTSQLITTERPLDDMCFPGQWGENNAKYSEILVILEFTFW